MLASPYEKYRQAQAQTANSSKLLLMLYDGAIRFVRTGIDGIEQKNIEKANNNLIKAQAILHELIATLNFDYEIAKNLHSLYEYMLRQLIQANIRKDKTLAEEVLGHLIEIKDAWSQIEKSDDSKVQQNGGRV